MSLPQPKKPPQRWRENIEAFTVAIVMAVMLKYFAVEAYQIPTGSMQPTLMGQEIRDRGQLVGEVKDRILVDKFSFHLRDPERFEVVIFKYPLNRAQNFVKRLVGLPGEQLKIQYGDLWQRRSEGEPWRIPRRPAKVMADHWKAIDLGTPARDVHWMADGNRPINERDIDASGEAKLTFMAHGGGPILDTYTHGYPLGMQEAMRKHPEFHRSNTHSVGDLRVTGRITPRAELATFVVELGEGGRRYRFEYAGPRAKEPTRARALWAKIEAYEPLAADAPALALESGRSYEFAVENLDDRLTLELDGEVVLALDVPSASDQTSSVRLELLGGGARLEDLQVWRDIYYSEGSNAAQWSVPEGHYFMMGDNTQDSSDSREWSVLNLQWQGSPGGQPVAGNAREAPADGRYRPDSNPIRERTEAGMTTFFRDVYGELHVFPKDTEVDLPNGERYSPAPFVPRHLITGRALAVFWPMSVSFKTYRIKWIH